MPYPKTTWVNNTIPDIDATHLNNLETGVSAAPYGPDGATNFVPVGDGSGGWLYQTIKNAQIDAAAAIAYSKLNLATSIVNADIAAGAAIALSKLASNPTGQPLGLTGATSATRYAGATAGGAPASGTFAVGDFVIDQTGKVFVCTVAGSPGTWVQVGAAGATSYRKTTAKTVNNTVVATDLLNAEITLAGGVLGTTGLCRLTAWGDFLSNSGASVAAPRLQLVLGATTLLDTGAASTTINVATRWGWRLSVEIFNLGATNSQLANLLFHLGAPNNATTPVAFTTGEGSYSPGGGIATAGVWIAEGTNTSAVDTTGALALKLNVINGTGSPTYETKLFGALVEVV